MVLYDWINGIDGSEWWCIGMGWKRLNKLKEVND